MGKLDEALLEVGETLEEGRWAVRKKLGGGGFGQVYAAFDAKLGKELAIKAEPRGKKEVLSIEAQVFDDLRGKPHCPAFYGMGGTPKLNFLVMEMLGKNLSDLRRECPGDRAAFSLRTAFLLSLQGLEALEDMHRAGHLHRDVKPSNYVMGMPGTPYRRTVFLIDFGLSRTLFTKEGELKPARPPGGFRGTVKFAAPAAHDGLDLARRDDIISHFYMMLEMTSGALPWRHLKDKKDVGTCKKTTTIDKLCDGLPDGCASVGREIFGYEYETEPDYARLKKLIVDMMRDAGGERNTVLDWDERWTHFLHVQNEREKGGGVRLKRKPSAVTATCKTTDGGRFGRSGMSNDRPDPPKKTTKAKRGISKPAKH